MSLTVSLYYTGINGIAKKFVQEISKQGSLIEFVSKRGALLHK